MVGPRERSLPRGMDRGMEKQQEYKMQNLQTSRRSPTAEGFTVYSEDSCDNRDHGQRQRSAAQLLDRRSQRRCKERSVEVLRMCKERLAKLRMKTILMVFIIGILFLCGLWFILGLSCISEPSNYGLDRSTGRAPIMVTGPTMYITYTVRYHQFHDARPVHHQEPVVVPSNLEATGQVIGQGPSHLVVTATSAPVSGLYFIPMSVTSGAWPQTQQDSDPSSHPARSTEGSQTLQGDPGLLDSKPGAKVLLQSRDIGAPRKLVVGQADVGTTPFMRWGVEVLYDMRRRSRRSNAFYIEWCVKNTCSPQKKLSTMCNTTKTISDSLQRQECEWCWPENQRKRQEIISHCTAVSKRALHVMLVICGIFLFCTLFIAIAFGTRMLRRRWRAKRDGVFHNHATIPSPRQEKTSRSLSHWFAHGMSKLGRPSKAADIRVDNITMRKRSPREVVDSGLWYESVFVKSGKRSGIDEKHPAPSQLRPQKQTTKTPDQGFTIEDEDSHERVPAFPPAPRMISSRVFSDIESMGQGRLLSSTITRTGNRQRDAQSSRQCRAVSSGSEQSPSGATYRRDAGAGLYNLQRLTELS